MGKKNKTNWQITLYDEYEEIVFSTDDYLELARYLGKSDSTIYGTIHRARYGVIHKLYDSDGKGYAFSIVDKKIVGKSERINKAIEYLYDNATFNLNDKWGKVFVELLDILEGED